MPWTQHRTGRNVTRTIGGRFRRSTIEDLGVSAASLNRLGGRECRACGKPFSPITDAVVFCGCDGRRRADDPISR
jgi:hypothetical protein